MKKTLKVIFINIAILAICLLVVELIFGGWLFSKNNLNNLGILREVNLEFDVKKLYPDSPGVVKYSRDKYGLRGEHTFNEPGKIGILTVGGSTTDQRFIDDAKTWQAVLEKNLLNNQQKLYVSNAGVDGQSSFGHIKNFEIWFPEIKDLHPKYILFYMGVNDFYRVAAEGHYDAVSGEGLGMKDVIALQVRNKSALYNLIRKINGVMSSKKVNIGHSEIDISQYAFVDTGIAGPELREKYQKENLAAFRQRLLILVDHCLKMGAKPIFVTQPTAHYRWQNGKWVGTSSVFPDISGFRFNGVDYFYLLNELNAVIKEVAGNQHIVVDLTNMPIWEPADFYDWVHMTPRGAAKVGNTLFNVLKDKL